MIQRILRIGLPPRKSTILQFLQFIVLLCTWRILLLHARANATSSTFASSVYTPGVPYVEEQFQVSTTVALLPLSLYVLGTAFGPMIAAPMSETLGRRAVYFCCLPIFGLFIIGAGFSTNIASLVICRFFAGVFGSPPLSIGAGTNADLFKPSQRGLVTGVFVLAPFLGPALG